MADTSKPDWLTRIMSGSDNQTPAIGRYIGAILFLNAGLLLPACIACALLGARVAPHVWFDYLGRLETYLPALGLTVGALIAGTHFTEPKPKPGDNQ